MHNAYIRNFLIQRFGMVQAEVQNKNVCIKDCFKFMYKKGYLTKFI